MGKHQFIDRNHKLPAGLVLQYHGRSDAHSKELGRLIAEDLVQRCPVIRLQATRGEIAYAINYKHTRPDGKTKALDLTIGIPESDQLPLVEGSIRKLGRTEKFQRILLACEEKAVMTEHGKSEPRVYSELNDSHVITHFGAGDAIAAAITMVNIAPTFISALRQAPDKKIEITKHTQPEAARAMVAHLRTLPIRNSITSIGLDAYSTFIIDADNQGHVALHKGPPAPQKGDPHSYETFLDRICAAYSERFSDLDHLANAAPLTLEDAFGGLAHRHPGLFEKAAASILQLPEPGARELAALLSALEPPKAEPGEEEA
jgi:hypothetical protein